MVWAAVVVSVAALGYSVYAGEEGAKAQRKSLRGQKQAQRQSLLSSIGQEKRAAQAEAKANRKKPNIESLLFSERAAANTGMGSTILAGRGGASLMGKKSMMVG
jgi:uncharacterized membrane protein